MNQLNFTDVIFAAKRQKKTGSQSIAKFIQIYQQNQNDVTFLYFLHYNRPNFGLALIFIAKLLLLTSLKYLYTSAGIYLLRVNNRITRTSCKMCSKVIIKTPERRKLHRSGVFIVSFLHISHLVLVYLLLTLSM